MKLFDFLNKFKNKKTKKTQAQMLNGFAPIFNMFGNDIYASDVVQQAISCIVTEMTKLSPQHIRKTQLGSEPVNGQLQRILDYPNTTMTQSDFLEKIMWNLFLNYNSFILPIYDITYDNDGNEVRTLTSMYPLSPIQTEILEDSRGILFINFKFYTGYETTVRYEDIIHIRYRYSVNEYMGGNELGQPDHDALNTTLELNNVLLQGVSKALKSSFAINGIVKYNTLMDDGKMEANLKKLEQSILDNESGFVGMDIKGEFIPLQNKIQLVDATTLKFIDEKILRHFGVPLSILTGDYTPQQFEAFHNKTLEPLIKKLGEAFTQAIFTDREKGFGNRIKFYGRELSFMTTSEKLEMARIYGDRGSMFENELREIVGLSPLPELAGVRMQSLNYVDSSIANKYQLGSQTNGQVVDDGSGDGATDGDVTVGVSAAQQVIKKPLLVGQINSLTEIVKGYQNNEYTYSQAKNMLVIGVGISESEATLVLDKQDEIIDSGGVE